MQHWPFVTMISWLTVRKLKRLLGFGTKRNERPVSLQDCLDRPQKKRFTLRILLLSCTISAALYYILVLYNALNLDHASYSEVNPMDDVDTFTEKMSFAELIAYEKEQIVQLRTTKTPKNETRFYVPGIAEDAFLPELPVCMTKIKVQNLTVITTKDANQQKVLGMVKTGGYYKPKDCSSRHKVGIIVPYRARQQNLAIFLYNIHPFLIRQKLEYRILVIEQNGTDLFNRGKLLNVGFLELQKLGTWNCVIVHDVDLLPSSDRVLYNCPAVPRHMCANVLQNRNPKFRSLYGGVAAMTADHFKAVNGYSNLFWGWGGEDNDMFWRLKASGIGLVRDSKKTSSYTALPHKLTQKKNPNRFRMLKTSTKRYKEDGLSDILYKVISYQARHLYTQILVDINPLRQNVSTLMSQEDFPPKKYENEMSV